MLALGPLELPFPYILSPMAGVSDLPFRMICRDFGSFLAYAEMISAKALTFGSRKTFRLLSTNAQDRPLAVQLLGGDGEVLRAAVEILGEYTFELLELNAACPVTKVVKRGEGAALMKEPDRLQRLIETLVASAAVPVTIKIRAGWDDRSVNAVEVARRAEDAGARAIFIHGRTRQQGYGGPVSYGVIREVKKAVTIPVIGSGNVFSARLAARMFAETGCDGVAVARGALGNPWIMRDLCTDRFNEKPAALDANEVIRVMRKHLDLSLDEHRERKGVINFRKFFIWYSKGFSNVARLRRGALSAKTGEEMHHMIDLLESERMDYRSL